MYLYKTHLCKIYWICNERFSQIWQIGTLLNDFFPMKKNYLTFSLTLAFKRRKSIKVTKKVKKHNASIDWRKSLYQTSIKLSFE